MTLAAVLVLLPIVLHLPVFLLPAKGEIARLSESARNNYDSADRLMDRAA